MLDFVKLSPKRKWPFWATLHWLQPRKSSETKSSTFYCSSISIVLEDLVKIGLAVLEISRAKIIKKIKIVISRALRWKALDYWGTFWCLVEINSTNCGVILANISTFFVTWSLTFRLSKCNVTGRSTKRCESFWSSVEANRTICGEVTAKKDFGHANRPTHLQTDPQSDTV